VPRRLALQTADHRREENRHGSVVVPAISEM